MTSQSRRSLSLVMSLGIATAILPAYAQDTNNSPIWMKVILGTGYEKPVQIHIFADHYRAPWYAHYALTKGHVDSGLQPSKDHLNDQLVSGESTGWLDISQMVYPDSGAHLQVYPAYGYGHNATQFNATIEFSTQPSDDGIVKTLQVNYTPSTLHLMIPPNLNTPENIAKLQSDSEVANHYGAIADHYNWPTIGKKPVKFPFFVTATLDPTTMDNNVLMRELKTLSNFGFNGISNSTFFDQYGFNYKAIGGSGWLMKSSYSSPNTEIIQKNADANYKTQINSRIKPQDISFAMVMDEPTGEKLEKIVNDQPSIEGFRQWLKRLNLTPQDLLVNTWDDVNLVLDADQTRFPALYYYSQQYRTIALGNFLALQKKMLLSHWNTNLPVVANFSDGAVYYGNMYGQGVDYFTLLHNTDQNALWSEDWSNGAATYQDASYNVELMRAAARKNGQVLGHYLIAYAGRAGYDIRLKAVSEVARGIKIFKSFYYGPVWAGHEPSAWEKNTQAWADQAAVIREIGAVEDYLLPAMPKKAQVALLYSSASDIWNQKNRAYGFERMNTWLALTHAQIPVDIIGEDDAAHNGLSDYKVCYLSDPHITRAAALKLRDWVQAGGTLVMTAGAGEYDEFNRPLNVLNSLLPYTRNPLVTLQSFNASGYYLTTLQPKENILSGHTSINLLSVKQTIDPATLKNPVEVISTFADRSPAEIRSASGKGFIVWKGYLPALDYMRQTLVTNNGLRVLAKNLNDNNGIPSSADALQLAINKKSQNPWQYPADLRNLIIQPTLSAHVETPLIVSTPLVDAVYMTSNKGVVIPLANYTLHPIKIMTLDIEVDKAVSEVHSVHQGALQYKRIANNKIRVELPLDCTDFITIAY